MWPALTRYFYYYLKNPARRDFVDMGLGIEARAKRCRTYWQKHLEFSKRFLSDEWGKLQGASSVAILGAGRLFDVDASEVFRRFKHIALYDADPSVEPYWETFRKQAPSDCRVDFHFVDLTGCLDDWTNSLTTLLPTLSRISSTQFLKEISSFLENLSASEDAISHFSFDAIVSLNLLSQIPIYWRDRAWLMIERTRRIDADWRPLIETALEESMAKLQLAHLKKCVALSKKQVLLISDLEFFYYTKVIAQWQVEAALYAGVAEAMCNNSYKMHDSWLWHIAPQGVEDKAHGSIHKVGAFICEPEN